MKSLRLLLVALASIPMIALAVRNEPDGFRGIAWGTEFSPSLGDMTITGESGRTKLYKRSGDKMSIGAAELKTIFYAFDDGRFTSVIIQTTGIVNNNAMLEALKAQFGEPLRPNRFMDDYYWKGKITTIALDCKISMQGDCTTFFMSSQSMDQQRIDREQKAKEAGSDF